MLSATHLRARLISLRPLLPALMLAISEPPLLFKPYVMPRYSKTTHAQPRTPRRYWIETKMNGLPVCIPWIMGYVGSYRLTSPTVNSPPCLTISAPPDLGETRWLTPRP